MIEKQLDFLAVGDVVTDIFVRLLDDEAKVEKSESGQSLVMPFATKVPFDYSRTVDGVGNAANAAVAAARLGLSAGLVANIGEDSIGRNILKSLLGSHVDTRFIHVNPDKASNCHFVLWYKEDRTILVNHEQYNYRWPRFRISDLPKWVYFSSLGQNARDYHDDIAEWLDAHPTIRLAFQPGTFQIEMGVRRLQRIYKRSEVVAVNREEAVAITGGDPGDIHDLLNKIHDLGPRFVMISDGHKGAYASDGQRRFKMPIYPDPAPPFERTGAGDAFTATFVVGLIRTGDIENALLMAPINAMSVVQKVGAQAGLLNMSELNHYLRHAPVSYHPERI